jgi:hypothetical protein
MCSYCCLRLVCFLIVRLPWLRVFRAFSSVVRQMPGYNSPRRGTARSLPKFLCCSMYCLFCVVLCIVCFVSFCVLFVCKCVLYCCHRVATQFQLTNISYHIISYHIISYHIISYHIISYKWENQTRKVELKSKWEQEWFEYIKDGQYK